MRGGSGPAKIARPRIGKVADRPRLYRLLDRERGGSVVWVCGPAGAGKTTLVASWLRARRLRSLWYQVDTRDADPANLFYYLGLAAPRTRSALPVLTPEYRLGVPAFTRQYFEALFARLRPPHLLVFDNFHELPAGAPVAELLALGLSELPLGVRAVVVSRAPPPAPFARHRADRRLRVVGWEQLRLTRAESARVLGSLGLSLGRKALEPLCARADGWAAGLVLMAEGLAPGSAPPGTAAAELVFDYLGAEVLDRAPEATRRLLLQTAHLPVVPASIAEALCGEPAAGRILRDLHRAHFFTERVEAPEPTYRFHGLFTEFLRQRAEAVLGREEIVQVRRRGAELFEGAGRLEEAVGLLRAAGDWPGMGSLMVRMAPTLMRSGRDATLREWFDALPPDATGQDPWLIYWQGMSQLWSAIERARSLLEAAHAIFEEGGDDLGALLSWCGIVDSFVAGFEDNRRLERWIRWLRKRQQGNRAFPTPVVEAQVAARMASALWLRSAASPDLAGWWERALRGSAGSDDPSLRPYVLSNYTFYLLMSGRMDLVTDPLAELRALAEESGSSYARAMADLNESYRCLIVGDLIRCERVVAAGIALAHEKGMHLCDPLFISNATHAALARGDLETAERWLERLRGARAGGSLQTRAIDLFYGAWLALHSGNAVGALRQLEEAKRITTGWQPYACSNIQIGLARAHRMLGAPERAQACLAEGQPVYEDACSAPIEMGVALAAAQIAFDEGRAEAGLAVLRKAMALGRELGLGNTTYCRHQDLAALCERALEAEIEVPYVRELIRRLRLAPATPPIACETWPWSLRIYTLGRFEIVRGGEPVAFGRKAPKKVLALLKALIALGGRDVTLDRLGDRLWPDADGDQSRKSLTVALHRLRALLGDKDAVLLREERLSLNPHTTWVDVWAFEKLLEGDVSRAPLERAERSLALYRGPFLGKDGGEAWATPMRERVRGVFRKGCEALGDELEKRGNIDRAAQVYTRALDADPTAEGLCQRLLRYHAESGRPAEAARAFARLRRALSNVEGREPNPATRAVLEAFAGV